VDVDFKSEHNFYSAKTRDISVGGLFIETDVGLPIGAHIEVDLRLPRTRATIPAEVVWALVGPDGRTEGVGVRFVELSAPMRERIESFMGLREALHVGEVEEDGEPGPAGTKGPPPLPGDD